MNETGNAKASGLRRAARRVRGVTLIELMVAVAIVGILAAIAYPSYQRQVQQTRRTDGKSALLEAAQRLERCYTRFNSYNAGGCDVATDLASGFESPEGWYEIGENGITATTFELVATPQDSQADDTRCGTLRLTHTGGRDADGTASDTCW